MPWWGYVLSVIGGGATLSFWGWVAISIISIEKDIVVLNVKIKGRLEVCEGHRTWLGEVEKKLDTVLATVNQIVGKLGA